MQFQHLQTSKVYFCCRPQAVITLILATDMARHGEILDSFKQKVDNFDFTHEEHVKCVRIYMFLQYHIVCPPSTSCLLYSTHRDLLLGSSQLNFISVISKLVTDVQLNSQDECATVEMKSFLCPVF